MPEPAAPRPRWRRWLVLSVRGLMGLVLVLAIALGWLVDRAHTQRDVVAAIKRARGWVVYDWQEQDPTSMILAPEGEPTPPGPKWLTDRLGPDYFGRVTGVQLGLSAHLEQEIAKLNRTEAGEGSEPAGPMPPPIDDSLVALVCRLDRLEEIDLSRNPGVTDAGLARLKRLRRLRNLDISRTAVTGRGLAHLEGMAQLRDLELLGIPASDADLAHVAALKDLETLSLGSGSMTNAGLERLTALKKLTGLTISSPGVDRLEPLRQLTNLKRLFLHGIAIDDTSMPTIAGLSSVTMLSLANTRISDAGLVYLEGRTRLFSLNLSNTRITDAGLAHLAGLSGLRFLDLSRTAITDAGLTQLTTLSGCIQMNLMETRVTTAGVSALKKALPKVTVLYNKGRPSIPAMPIGPPSLPTMPPVSGIPSPNSHDPRNDRSAL